MTAAPSTTVSRWKLWLFRLAPLLAGPLAVVAVEAAIRLTGWGMPSAEQIRNTKPVGLPVFECSATGDGSRLCRTSGFFSGFIGPQKFVMPKPAGTVRIFCLGESVAAGYPFYLPGSFAKFMSVMLAGNSSRFEVINVGVQGLYSADVRILCREIAQYDPDWIVIYMGNNEFLGLDPGRERGWKADLRDRLRRRLAPLRLSYIVNFRIQGDDGDGTTPELLAAAVAAHETNSRKTWDEAARRDVTRRFEENLNAMIDLAQAHGAGVILSTVAVNLRGFHPFRHDEHWPGADGCQAPPPDASAAELSPAAAAERDECVANPGRAAPTADAVEAYRRGCCALWAGDPAAARDFFLTAAGHDRLLIRATPAFNAIIRRTAVNRGLPLADVETAFASASKWGIPGDDLFLDHVHPDLPGAALIARTIINTLAAANAVVIEDEMSARMDREAETYRRSIPPAFLYSSYFTDAGHVIRYGAFNRAARLYRKAAAADPQQTGALEAAERAESWARKTATELK